MKHKNHLILFSIILIFPFALKAQTKIEVSTESIKFSKGQHTAYKVEIPQAEFETVKKEWIKLIRQNTKSKVEESGGEVSIQGTVIKEIYDQPMNIYSTLITRDTMVRLFATFEIDSVFFEIDESDTDVQREKIHTSIKKFLRSFAVDQYKQAVQIELENEKKQLNAINKEYASLTKQVENDRKEIKSNEQNIKNSQDAIVNHEKENERLVTQINEKKQHIQSVKNDPELQKTAKSQLKDLEKEKKSIENNLASEQKNIVKYQAAIEELNRKIENNLTLIEEKKAAISNQENIIKQVSAKLNGIK